MKQGKKAVLISAAAAAVAVVLLGVLFLPRLFRTPAKAFLAYQQEAIVKPLLSVPERAPEALSGGELSTDITVSVSTDDPEVNRLLEGLSLTLKVQGDGDTLLLNGELTQAGSPVLSGAAVYEGDRFGFRLPEIDDNYYVMDLTGLSGGVIDRSGRPEISGEEWAALLQAYVDVMATAVNEDNVTAEKRVDFRLEELNVSCTGDVYTFAPTAADVETVINALADRLEEDRELLLKMMGGQLPGYAGEDPAAAPEEELTELVKRLRDGAAQMGQSAEENGFAWRLYTEGEALRMIRVESGGNSVVMECSGDPKEGAVVLFGNTDGEKEVLLRWEFSERDGVRTGGLRLNGGDSSISVDYSMDTEKRSVLGVPYGSYTLSVPEAGTEFRLTVAEGAAGSTDCTVTVRSGPQEMGGGEVTVRINATAGGTAQAPAGTPVDIAGYSEEERQALAESLIGGLYSRLFSVL